MSKKAIIIIIITITITLIIGLAIFYFINANKSKSESAGALLKENTTSSETKPTPALILLSASNNKVLTGETFSVSINISSRTASDGTDIIILYDPSLLSVESVSEKAVSVGTIYQEYPINNDDKNGKIVVSGISSQQEGNIASGLFGTIKFKALKKGTAKITLDFKKGSTTDSNVIETQSSSDILEAVQNTEVLID